MKTGPFAVVAAVVGEIVLLAAGAPAVSRAASGAASWDEAKVVAEATGGTFKSTKGQYLEKACGEKLSYDAEVIDLNADGRPEVFVHVHGTCLGGHTGVQTNLYIKGADGKWTNQFGFPGIANVLKTKSKGYPDIEIGGPGFCFPVWRWNGKAYDIFKKCPA